MEAITEAGVSVNAHNLGLETLIANDKRNSVAGIVIAVIVEWSRVTGAIDAMETG
jgi:hypothetical protein